MKTNIKDKEYSRSITVLAFCSAFTEFMASIPDRTVFPKERIIGLVVLCFAGFLLAKLINPINLENIFFKLFSFCILSARMVYIIYRYIQYYRTFYGDGTVWIILFTAVIAVAIYGKNKRISVVYILFLLSNICMLVLLLFLSVDIINTANIYSAHSSQRIYMDTVLVFFDVFTVALLIKDKKERTVVQNRFLLITLFVFVAITVLQGLCIKGDLLYSVSPLQAIVQVFSGETVKRYDYIFNILFAVDYFGAVVLYVTALNSLIKRENTDEKN